MNRRKRLTLIAAVWLALAGTGVAADGEFRASKPEVRKEVLAVVEGQLAAFRAGEVRKAYGLAALALRTQTSLRAFESMVRNNYAEIWNSLRVEHGLVRDDGSHATVLVHVFAKEADAAFDYVLIKESAGWRIGSVSRHEPRLKDNL